MQASFVPRGRSAPSALQITCLEREANYTQILNGKALVGTKMRHIAAIRPDRS